MYKLLKRLWIQGNGTIPKRKLLANAPADHASRLAQASPDDEASQLFRTLSDRARRTLRRSVHIRHLAGGSPNDCEWEMTALLNPVYDVQRFGIDFVASPRHADLLLVTGGVTANLAAAVRATYEAMPEPRVVVAVGDDACGRGLIGPTYAQFGGVDKVIPVDIYVPGDPPTPTAILQAIMQAIMMKS